MYGKISVETFLLSTDNKSSKNALTQTEPETMITSSQVHH